jgi:hypothetical protein
MTMLGARLDGHAADSACAVWVADRAEPREVMSDGERAERHLLVAPWSGGGR